MLSNTLLLHHYILHKSKSCEIADKRFAKMFVMFCICVAWQKRTVQSTHHCCYFRSSVVVDADQHERWQEEEEGAGNGVHQVLQEDTETYKITGRR